MLTNRRNLIAGAAVLAVLIVAAVAVYLTIGTHAGRPVTIDLRVSGTTMTPNNPSAHQGDRVTMTITADKAEEIHLHGYDIPFEVPSAGGHVTHTFTADKSGSFEMEIEDTSTHLTQFTVNP